MIDIRANGYSFHDLLTGAPKITDQLDGVCRTLDIQLDNTKEVNSLLGKTVELYKGSDRLFYGKILKRGVDQGAQASLLAYDPLYSFRRNPDDYYYKKNTVTATKVIHDLAAKTGVTVGKLASTRVIMPALYYQAGDPDKIAIDVLARTKAVGGKNFWYRFDPSKSNFGLYLFEKVVPKEVWAFQIGINLTSASYEESAEELVTQVKLVNRDTGKIVIRKNSDMYDDYGKLQHFEEVDKDHEKTMDRTANSLLSQLSRIKVTSRVAGVNPGNMPMLYSGDVIYVEEKHTGIMGAYYIRNIDQEYVSDKLINISMDVERSAAIPDIQYSDALKDPNAERKAAAKKKAAAAAKKKAAAAKKKAAAAKKK